MQKCKIYCDGVEARLWGGKNYHRLHWSACGAPELAGQCIATNSSGVVWEEVDKSYKLLVVILNGAIGHFLLLSWAKFTLYEYICFLINVKLTVKIRSFSLGGPKALFFAVIQSSSFSRLPHMQQNFHYC